MCVTTTLLVVGQVTPFFAIRVGAVAAQSDLLPAIRAKLATVSTVPIPDEDLTVLNGHLGLKLTMATCSNFSLAAARAHPAGQSELAVAVTGVYASCLITATPIVALPTPPFHVWLEVAANLSLSLAVSPALISIAGSGASGGADRRVVHMAIAGCQPAVVATPHFPDSWTLRLVTSADAIQSRLSGVVSSRIAAQICPAIADAVGAKFAAPPPPPVPGGAAPGGGVGAGGRGVTVYVEGGAEFSLLEGIRTLWHIGERLLALVLLVFSGVWPHTKQVLLVVAAFAASSPSGGQRRWPRRVVGAVDALGKWSMLDVLFVAALLLVLNFSFRGNLAAGALAVVPLGGVLFYTGGILISLSAAAAVHAAIPPPPRPSWKLPGGGGGGGRRAFVERELAAVVSPAWRAGGGGGGDGSDSDATPPPAGIRGGWGSEGDDLDNTALLSAELAAAIGLPPPPRAPAGAAAAARVAAVAAAAAATWRSAAAAAGRVARNGGVHVAMLVATCGSMAAPLFSLRKTVDIDALGHHEVVVGSLPAQSAAQIAGAVTAAQALEPDVASVVPTATASAMLVAWVVALFVVVAPLAKWALAASVALGGAVGSPACPAGSGGRTRRVAAILTALWPWDMRCVFIVALVLLRLRAAPMVSSMSSYVHYEMSLLPTLLPFAAVVAADYAIYFAFPSR